MASSQKPMGSGGTKDSSPNRLRKVLSLDGGGIRGLSSIIILGYLMDQLSEVRGKRVEPWEEFDMIGGTSTGGITAIMLGRLRMSIDECENAYTQLADAVFAPRHASLDPRRLTNFLKANGKFDEQPLEAMIKEKVSEANLDEQALLHDEREDACKVFVSVVRAEDGSPSVIRSYPSGRFVNRLLRHCKIWEAARATSAASTFFDPITIGPHNTKFIDGGLRHNNPIDLVDRESRNLWPNEDRLLISIGTGDAPGGSFEGALKDLVDRLKEIATETQHTSNRFLHDHSNMIRNKCLFRYNVHGLGTVGLDESRARSTIVARTESYLESPDVLDKSEDCIGTLALGGSRTLARLGSRIEADIKSTSGSAQQRTSIGPRIVKVLEACRIGGDENWTSAVDFSPDGQLLASGSSDTTIKLWEVATGELRHTMKGHTNFISAVAFSRDSQLLASGSHDKTVKLWKVVTGELQHTIKAHTGWVTAVAFSPDVQLLASGTSDNAVKLWDVATGEERYTTKGKTGIINVIAFSPDGQLLASGTSDNAVQLWEVATGELRLTIKGHTGWVGAVAFSPNGKLLASGAADNAVKLWDVATGEERRTIKGYTGKVCAIAFSPDSQLLASGSWDKTITLCDVATGEIRYTTSIRKGFTSVSAVAFSPDGQLLASGIIYHSFPVTLRNIVMDETRRL